MKRTPEMEQLLKEEIEYDVLKDLEAEFKAQGSWVQPGSEGRLIEIAVDLEAEGYDVFGVQAPESDMENDDVS